MKWYLHLCGSRTSASGERVYQIIEVEFCTLFNKLTITLVVFSREHFLSADVIWDLYWCILCSPHSSSSELSPQSSTLLQTWSVRRHTWSFLQRKGLVGGQRSFAGDEKTRQVNVSFKKQCGIFYEKTMKYSLLENRKIVVYKICISCLQRKSILSDSFNPPHMSLSSSELSPQSSLPSHTHVWSLHKVLLQMNSSARQKKAPAITQISSQDF